MGNTWGVDGRAGVALVGGVLRGVGVVSVDPPSATTGATVTKTVTITGARVGDIILLIPPDTLEDGLTLEGAAVTANDTVTISIINTTAGTIDGAALDWGYLWIDRSA